MFWNHGYKMLMHGGENLNDGNDSDTLNSQHGYGNRMKHGQQFGQTPWNLEGRAMSALSRFGENARRSSDPTWLRRVQHQHAIMEPPSNDCYKTYFLNKIKPYYLKLAKICFY